MLAFPAALELWRLARARQVGVALGGLLVTVLAFAAVTNTSINEDNPLYGEEVAVKQGLTASEAATVEFLDRHLVTHTAVDWQVWNYFRSLVDLDLLRVLSFLNI